MVTILGALWSMTNVDQNKSNCNIQPQASGQYEEDKGYTKKLTSAMYMSQSMMEKKQSMQLQVPNIATFSTTGHTSKVLVRL